MVTESSRVWPSCNQPTLTGWRNDDWWLAVVFFINVQGGGLTVEGVHKAPKRGSTAITSPSDTFGYHFASSIVLYGSSNGFAKKTNHFCVASCIGSPIITSQRTTLRFACSRWWKTDGLSNHLQRLKLSLKSICPFPKEFLAPSFQMGPCNKPARLWLRRQSRSST